MEIIGHRGVAHEAPENTLASVALAWEQGADAVEIDVQLSKDHEIVVMHDYTTLRTTGVEGSISEMTWDELRRLDAGIWKGAHFAGQKIPSLAEVLAVVPSGKRLVVEFKSVGPEMLARVQDLLERVNPHPDQVFFISYDYDILKQLGSAVPQYKALLLRQPPHTSHGGRVPMPLEELIERARSAGMYGLNLHYGWPIDGGIVRQVHDAGLKLYAWTVNDPDIACQLVRFGVDGITTDRAGFIREALARMV